MLKPVLKRGRFWVATGFSLLFIFLALRGVDFAQVWGTLAQADYGLALVALGTVIVTTMAKAARWRVLFYPENGHLRYHKLLSIVFIGQMLNFVLPGRLGELARAYLMGEIEGESKVRVLGTIALEKTMNLAMLCLSFVVLLPSIAIPQWLEHPGLVSALATSLAFIVFAVLAVKPDKLSTWINRLGDRLPDGIQTLVSRYVGLALSSLEALRHGPAIWRLSGWSVLVWLLAVSTNYVAFLAVGLPLSLTAAVFLLLVLQLGVAVPSLPGRTPMFYLSVLALSIFAIDKDQALGYAALLYGVVYVPPLLLGAVLLIWENVDLHRIRATSVGYEVAPGDLS